MLETICTHNLIYNFLSPIYAYRWMYDSKNTQVELHLIFVQVCTAARTAGERSQFEDIKLCGMDHNNSYGCFTSFELL